MTFMEQRTPAPPPSAVRSGVRISVIIPALNEEASIGLVLRDLPKDLHEAIVVDNGSSDRTAEVACAHGARVIQEPQRGYGSACLAGMAVLDDPDVVVFLDADYSDHPDELAQLLQPIVEGHLDFVIGSRTRGIREQGALTFPQRFGNRLACLLMNLFWRTAYSDLGPFRAIRYSALRRLGMSDRDFGWTIQMQIRAAKACLRIGEVPVRYRRRIGTSKISGTVKGVVGAGSKILYTIFHEACALLPRPMPGHPERLIVFTRYPEPGQAKTRLIPALGPHGAAACQHGMTAHALTRAAALSRERGTSVEVRFTGGDEARMRAVFGNWNFKPQGAGDLGERMQSAVEGAFARGCGPVVVSGADCPALSSHTFREAFEALASSDLVLGPSADGGYYLIGLRQMESALFKGVSWGRSSVLQEALEMARNAGLHVHLLEELQDIDRPEDLGLPSGSHNHGQPWLSIVIPAKDEAAGLPQTLRNIPRSEALEVIVVDGHSTDETAALARQFGCQVIRCPAGRARQMNAGAAVARGKVLLFLHADTQLPDAFLDRMRLALAQPGTAAGAFRLRIDGASFKLRIVEYLVNLRSRIRQMPYGDQALFVSTELFRQLGGFHEHPVMEDFEFVERLRRRGRIVMLQEAVLTSARCWTKCGVLKTTWINQLTIMGYRLGVAPERLALWREAKLGQAGVHASGVPIHLLPPDETSARIPGNPVNLA